MDKIKNIVIVAAKSKGYKFDGKNIVGPTGNIRKLYIDSKGYKCFNIRVDRELGKRAQRTIYVHRFVAYLKFGNRIFDEEIVVRHLDGNSLNNSFINIGIGSQSDNMMDVSKEKRIERALFASSHRRINNNQKEKEIVEFYKSLRSYKKTMEKYNIKKPYLHYIIKKWIVSSDG